MKRILFDACGDPADVLYLSEQEDPVPGPGEVLLRLRMRPINPSDIAFISGAYVPPDSYPACPCMEGVGTVRAVGEGVAGIETGGRYIVSRVRGTWAEYMVLPANALVPVPDEIPDELACQMTANPLTAWLLLEDIGQPGAVVQTAAGSAVGRLVDQLGARQGRTVINLVRNPATALDLKAHGASHVIVTAEADWRDQVRRAAGAEPVVAAFDPVAGSTGEDLLQVLSPGGVLILYGALSGEPVRVNAMALAGTGLSVRGFWLAPWFADTPEQEQVRVFGGIVELFRRRELDIPVAGVFDLQEFRAAIERVLAPGRLGKILLRG